MSPGDSVVVTHVRSSFKGCLGYLVRKHETFDDCWWVHVQGFPDMMFPEYYLEKL